MIWMFLGIFILGLISSVVFSYFISLEASKEMPLSVVSAERMSPFDHVKESQIHVYKDNIVIDIEDAFWARFADTNSMDPIIDSSSNSIEIKPLDEKQIHVGDMISYKFGDDLIIHRVVYIGEDADGWYALTKGDNLTEIDPLKIRFDMVKGIVVGVIY